MLKYCEECRKTHELPEMRIKVFGACDYCKTQEVFVNAVSYRYHDWMRLNNFPPVPPAA